MPMGTHSSHLVFLLLEQTTTLSLKTIDMACVAKDRLYKICEYLQKGP